MYTFRLLLLFFVVILGAYVEHQAKKSLRKPRREMRRAENYDVLREEAAVADIREFRFNRGTPSASIVTKEVGRNVRPTQKMSSLNPEGIRSFRRFLEYKLADKQGTRTAEPVTSDRPMLLLIRSPGTVQDLRPARRTTPW